MYNRVRMPGRRLRLPPLLTLAALLAPLVTPAYAHTEPAPPAVTVVSVAERAAGVASWADPSPATMRAGSSALVAGALALALVALACALGRRRPRRTVAVVVGLLLVVFAFESGVHSVHHSATADPSHCAVASAVAHLSGDVATLETLPAPAAGRRSGAHPDDSTSAVRPLRPDSGRAPPPLA
jgi:hypothetical protein